MGGPANPELTAALHGQGSSRAGYELQRRHAWRSQDDRLRFSPARSEQNGRVTTTTAPPRPAPAGEHVPAGSRLLPVLAALAVVAGVVFRLHSQSALWLDEALSVNIAKLPLSELPAALRQDGAPPLYYLLLHGWMAVFGTSTTAVRALSAVFAVAALPLAWLLGRRLADARTGWIALLLLASSPFAVRYATETRMYSLVLVLVLVGGSLLVEALRRPTLPRLLGVALCTTALMLTHYWALYLLTTTGALLLVLSLRGGRQPAARRCVGALVVGGLLFLPWLPSFLFQAEHTGTPWVNAPKPSAVLSSIGVWGGGLNTAAGGLLLLLLVALAVLALLGRRVDGGVVLAVPVSRTAAALCLVSLGTLVLGIALAVVTSAGYAPRYSSAAFGPFLVLAAMGATALPRRARTPLLAVAVAAGLFGSAMVPLSHLRTEAPRIARALRAELQPGDLVVYCPDQTGPAVSRLLPVSTDQVVYPTLGRPERVDWVDYAQRNAKASPTAFADRVLARTSHTIWLVAAGQHLTFGHQCEDLDRILTARRGGRELLVPISKRYGEWAQLTRYAPAG